MKSNGFMCVGGVGGALMLSAQALAADPVAHDWVALDADAFEPIRQRVSGFAPSLELSAEQVSGLVERHAALLEVRVRDTVDDYLALLQSWGGEYRLDPNSWDFTEARVVDWHGRDSGCAWKQLDLSSVEAARVHGLDTGVPYTAGWPRVPRGATGTLALGAFTFGGDMEAMVKRGAPVVQILASIETTDGTRMTFGVRWVWDADAEAWVPWHAYQFGEPGRGVCVLFY